MDNYEKAVKIAAELKAIGDKLPSFFPSDKKKRIDCEFEVAKELMPNQNRAAVLNNIQNLLDARRSLIDGIFRGCFTPEIRKAYDELDVAFMSAIKAEASNPDLFLEYRQSTSLN